MTRTEVYHLIDGERAYQDVRWGQTLSSDQPGDGSRTIDEFALYIQGYANDLTQVASHTGRPEAKLDCVRKIAALCVACMEQHGAPPRQGDQPIRRSVDMKADFEISRADVTTITLETCWLDTDSPYRSNADIRFRWRAVQHDKGQYFSPEFRTHNEALQWRVENPDVTKWTPASDVLRREVETQLDQLKEEFGSKGNDRYAKSFRR